MEQKIVFEQVSTIQSLFSNIQICSLFGANKSLVTLEMETGNRNIKSTEEKGYLSEFLKFKIFHLPPLSHRYIYLALPYQLPSI